MSLEGDAAGPAGLGIAGTDNEDNPDSSPEVIASTSVDESESARTDSHGDVEEFSPRTKQRLFYENSRGYPYYIRPNRAFGTSGDDTEPQIVPWSPGNNRRYHTHQRGGRARGREEYPANPHAPRSPSPLPAERRKLKSQDSKEEDDNDGDESPASSHPSRTPSPRPATRIETRSTSFEDLAKLTEQSKGKDWGDEDDDEYFNSLLGSGDSTRVSTPDPDPDLDLDATPDHKTDQEEDIEEAESLERLGDRMSMKKPASVDDYSSDIEEAPPSPSSVEMLESCTGITVEEGARMVKEENERQRGRTTRPTGQEYLNMMKSIITFYHEVQDVDRMRHQGTPKHHSRTIPEDPEERNRCSRLMAHRYRLLRDDTLFNYGKLRDAWRDDKMELDDVKGKLATQEERYVNLVTSRIPSDQSNTELLKRLTGVEKQLADALEHEEEQRIRSEEYKERANKVGRQLKMYKDWAEANNSLAERERRRQELESREVGTQTSGSFTPIRPITNPYKSAPPNLWPINIRTETVSHCTSWINNHAERNYHGTHGISTTEPLRPAQLDEIFGDGTNTFETVIDRLRQAGYVFREDHFAQELERWLLETQHPLDVHNDIMYAARRLTTDRDRTGSLLAEITEIRVELRRAHNALDRAQSAAPPEADLAAINAVLAQNEQELKDELDSIERQCNDANKQLTEEKGRTSQLQTAKSEFEAEVQRLKVALESKTEAISDNLPGAGTSVPDDSQKDLSAERERLRHENTLLVGMFDRAAAFADHATEAFYSAANHLTETQTLALNSQNTANEITHQLLEATKEVTKLNDRVFELQMAEIDAQHTHELTKVMYEQTKILYDKEKEYSATVDELAEETRGFLEKRWEREGKHTEGLREILAEWTDLASATRSIRQILEGSSTEKSTKSLLWWRAKRSSGVFEDEPPPAPVEPIWLALWNIITESIRQTDLYERTLGILLY